MTHRLAPSPRAPADRVALALSAALALVWAEPARAHGATQQVERRADRWAVRVTHHGGKPLAGATYQVLRPGAGEPVQVGKTGADGWVEFRPDVPGTWRVKVVEASGHGRTVEVEVAEAPAAPAGAEVVGKPSTSTATATATSTATSTATTTGADATTGAGANAPATSSSEDRGPRPLGTTLVAAGILAFFLALRRVQRRARAGR